ncbi:MAG: hypothetical protein ACRD3B_16195, partial [Candidatus Sulfotelmatobacter sp.]
CVPLQTNLSSDVSDSAAELNPLLNPLLADHMGRWAEVYFTSQPETREDAVLELLRELQRKESRPKSRSDLPPWPGAASGDAHAEPKPSSSITKTITAKIEEHAVQCSSCGHENPALHRFCGGCGAALTGDTNSEHSPVAMSRPAETNPEMKGAEQRGARSHETGVDEIRARLDPERRQFEDSIAHPGELSLFRSFRERDGGGDDWDETPVRGRFLLVAVLAILIAGAIYMAWRSGQLSARHSHEGQSTQAAIAKDNSAGNNASANASGPKPAPPPQAAKTVTTPVEKPQPVAQASPMPAGHQQAVQQISTVVSRTPAPSVSMDNGSEELAVAQHYLSGDNGRRDSAEAAKWLWKSISKHNGEATVMLADLYLKGDGVSKNCDQARVLLDTAGRKGVAGAGQRLRNLPAFGCQ